VLQSLANMGCGPFGNTSHVDLFRLWLPGDTFLVYPAVYTGTTYQGQTVSNNNITLRPMGDYYISSGNPIYAPNNITIKGVTVNGIRPVIVRNDNGGGDSETSKDVVEIIGGANDTIENIGITLGTSSQAYVLEAGLYLIHVGYNDYDQYGNALTTPVLGSGNNFTTISNLHIHGFEQVQAQSGGADGVISDPTSGGTVLFISNEIDHNGGTGAQNSSGLAHGIYMQASNTQYGNPTYDPNFNVTFEGNWFHDQFYGHDLKSRAQNTIIVGNYFQGGLPQGGIYTTAESFGADLPNGGVVTIRGNIFTKNASGYASGTFNVAYGEEGFPGPSNSNETLYDGPNGGPRTNSINFKNNTFVAFARTTDGTHPLIPFEFFYPAQSPSAAGFPVSSVNVNNNAFVGYCPVDFNSVQAYTGTSALSAGFADMSQAFSFGGLWVGANNNIVGLQDYVHELIVGARTKNSVGGED